MSKKPLPAQPETLEKIAQKKPLAISILILTSLLFATIIGLVLGILGSFVYLIILYPIVTGSILGHLIYRNALDLKVKKWSWILVTSLLSALVLYWMYQYGRYFTLQAIATYKLFGGFSDKEVSLAQQIVQQTLMKETGHGGITGYLLFTAQEGISVGKIISSSKLTLQGWLAWIYWLGEFGLIAYFTAITSRDASSSKESEDVDGE